MNIPTPTQSTEAPKSKSLRRTLLGVGGATLFLLGIGVGGADSQPAPTPAALPAVTTTATATITESVSVPETPQECKDALDKSDTLLDLAGQGFQYATDALDGASTLDVDKINKATKGLQKLNPKVEAARSDYDTAASACRSN